MPGFANARTALIGLLTDSLPDRLQPLSLTSTRSGVVMTATCATAIFAVAVLENVRPGLASLGSLLFLPVLVASWLLAYPEWLALSGLAVGARLFGHSLSGVDIGTVTAEASMIVALALTARLAANAVVHARETEARLRQQTRAQELLAQQEEIARKLNDGTVQRLFRVTIQLEAASALLESSDTKQRLEAAIKEVDAMCAEFRSLVFLADGSG